MRLTFWAFALACIFFVLASSRYAVPAQATMEYSPATPPELLSPSGVLGRERNLPFIVRRQFVNVNQAALLEAAFSVRLFDGANLTVVRDSRQSLREAIGPGATEGSIWRGHVEGIRESQVSMVASNNYVAGTITLEDTSRVYSLVYAGNGRNGTYALYEIDRNLIPGDYTSQSTAVQSAKELGRALLANTGSSRQVDPNCPLCMHLISILGVHTNGAVDEAGSEQAINNAWYLSIDWANIAFDNSDVDVRFVLVATRMVTYTEIDPLYDLGHLHHPFDGQLDEVHLWRNQYYADLVQMAGRGYCCGLAVGYNSGYSSEAFSLVNWLFLNDGHLPAHENAHNLGCGHGRTEGPGGWFSYSWGYANPDGYFHDIMAGKQGCNGYLPCKLIQNFSNPDVYWCCTGGGAQLPTGIEEQPPPDTTSADCARTIRELAPSVENFR
jgi:hypothetical protein